MPIAARNKRPIECRKQSLSGLLVGAAAGAALGVRPLVNEPFPFSLQNGVPVTTFWQAVPIAARNKRPIECRKQCLSELLVGAAAAAAFGSASVA